MLCRETTLTRLNKFVVSTDHHS